MVELAAIQKSISIVLSEPGARPVSIVRSREVSLFRRLQMYYSNYIYSNINRGHGIWPLFGGCPLLGEFAIRGLLYIIIRQSLGLL